MSNGGSAGLRYANIALVICQYKRRQVVSVEKQACLCRQTGIPNNGVKFSFAVEDTCGFKVLIKFILYYPNDLYHIYL